SAAVVHSSLLFCSFFHFLTRRPPTSTLFPYTTLFRSSLACSARTSSSSGVAQTASALSSASLSPRASGRCRVSQLIAMRTVICRSEEHTSELQSRGHLVCRLLLEKKKTEQRTKHDQTK